jgi:GntR family transcriptional regulator/MocR family aminotransferase
VIAAAAQQRVRVVGVSPYRLAPAPTGGLIFGYANLSERAIAEGVARIATAIQTLTTEHRR